MYRLADEPERKTLVLDLDETLVHSWEDPTFVEEFEIYTNPERFRFFHPVGEPQIVYSMLYPSVIWGVQRPHLNRFLNAVSKKMNVVVWSAGVRPYVDKIVDQIFANSGLPPPKLVWAREQCKNHNGLFHKPLAELSNVEFKTFAFDPKSTLIIDDRLHTFMSNPNNGVLIPAFDPGKNPTWEQLTDRSDDVLLRLERWLLSKEVLEAEDVRAIKKEFMSN